MLPHFLIQWAQIYLKNMCDYNEFLISYYYEINSDLSRMN